MAGNPIGVEAKDLKLYNVGNAKPLKKFEQVIWGDQSVDGAQNGLAREEIRSKKNIWEAFCSRTG